jgi:hypothetical protein
MRVTSGFDRHLDVLRRRLVPVGENVLMVVRHHRACELARAILLATDYHWDLDALTRHALESFLERFFLGRTISV